MNPKVKRIIRESITRVQAGKGSAQDQVIHLLLEHNRKFQQRIKELEEGGTDNVPVHQQKPWYME